MKTIPVTARIDPRSLALAVQYYHDKGYFLRTRSSIINAVLQEFAQHLVTDLGLTPITTMEEAFRHLSNFAQAAGYSPEEWRGDYTRGPVLKPQAGDGFSELSEEERMKLVWDTLGTPPEQRVLPSSQP